ncbi:MAG: hypothetical protein ABI728_01425 [Betaproteobacteria bacterium]
MIPPPPEIRLTPLRTVEAALMETPPFWPLPTMLLATASYSAVVNVPSSVTDPVPPAATTVFSRNVTPMFAPPFAFPARP